MKLQIKMMRVAKSSNKNKILSQILDNNSHSFMTTSSLEAFFLFMVVVSWSIPACSLCIWYATLHLCSFVSGTIVSTYSSEQPSSVTVIFFGKLSVGFFFWRKYVHMRLMLCFELLPRLDKKWNSCWLIEVNNGTYCLPTVFPGIINN